MTAGGVPANATGYPHAMTYILSFVVIAIAVVLAIFTGIWGGLIWIVAAGIALAIVLAVRARTTEIDSVRTTPTGRPRAPGTASGSANERVGQS
jgi:hypothetical protein